MPRLVLVSAPAGFGKTTLIAQWLASGERGGGEGEPAGQSPRVAWLSLDAEDSELRRFLTHLVAAIQASSPQVGGEALALLESGQGLPAEAVLVSLVKISTSSPGRLCWLSMTTTSSTHRTSTSP